jgi:hypothetical protein
MRSFLLLLAVLCCLWLAFHVRSAQGRSPESDAAAALALRQAPLPPQAPVNPEAPKQSRRPDGGYCSPQCACPCTSGGQCVCGTFRTPQTAPQPHVHPVGPPVGYAPPVQSYAMPVAFPAMSCGRGG